MDSPCLTSTRWTIPASIIPYCPSDYTKLNQTSPVPVPHPTGVSFTSEQQLHNNYKGRGLSYALPQSLFPLKNTVKVSMKRDGFSAYPVGRIDTASAQRFTLRVPSCIGLSAAAKTKKETDNKNRTGNMCKPYRCLV